MSARKTQDPGRDLDEKDIFEGTRRLRKAQWTSALAVMLGVLIVYIAMVAPGALPWQPADLLASISGVKENIIMRHVVWRKLIGFVIWAGGSSFVLAVNIVCAVIGALAVGMMVMVSSSLLNVMIDDGRYQRVRGGSRNHRNIMCIVGGIVAGLSLAFSAPFWMAATQTFVESFYLLWLLFAVFMLLRFAETNKTPYVYVFFFFYAAGMTQTSSFMALAPLCLIYAIFLMWTGDRLTVRSGMISLLLMFAGGLLLFYNAADFHGSEGYILLRNVSYLDVVKKLLQALSANLLGGGGKGWMIPLGTCIAPFLAMLLTGSKSLNGERDWSYYVLNAVMAGVTLAVLLETPVSPWQFFNVSQMHIVPYAMTALTFGYIVAYLYSLSFSLFPDERSAAPSPGRMPAVIRSASLACAAVIMAFALFNNYSEANHKRMGFVWEYVDTLFDNLDGRRWIVTNGVFDDVILLRAKERGMDVNTLNLGRGNNRIYMEATKEKFDNVRLRNAAEIGLFPLIQDMIAHTPEVTSELALCLFPDLWGLGGYQVYPHGLAFHGADNATMEEVLKRDLKAEHFAIIDRLTPSLGELPDVEDVATLDTSARRDAWYKQTVKGQISFVGNNLAYLLETSGNLEEAFDVYQRVHKLDPKNVSALLNYASIIQRGMHPELKDSVMDELEKFQENLESPLQIWSLSSVYGYVSSPDAFAQLGWTWAMSGMQNLALNSLSRAMENVRPENRGALRSVIAEVHMQDNDLEAGERVYKEILAEDPADHRALLGLARICVMKGDSKQAQEYLTSAREAGVPEVKILYETAALEMMQGEIDRARIIAHQLAELDSQNSEAQTLLCLVYSHIYSNAKTKEEATAAEAGMRKASDKLEEITMGKENYQVLFLKGHVNTLFLEYTAARENFRSALKLSPTSNVVPLLEYILRLDFAIPDQPAAAADAKAILHRDSENAFANYIMGSIAISEGDDDSAEAFLERSLARDPNSILVLNDLAVTKLKLGKIDEAEALIRKSFTIDKQLYAAWDTLGSVLMAQGKIGEAEEAFATALRLNENDMRVHLHMAQVYFKKGEIAKSREIMSKLSSDTEGFGPGDIKDFKELERALQDVKKK